MSSFIEFNFSKIDTIQFAIILEAFTKNNEIHIKTNLEYGLIPEKNEVKVIPEVYVLQNDSPFIIIKTENYFNISTDSWNHLLKDNLIVFPKGFIQHITFLALGTLRGILHAKTEKSILCDFVLPTINLQQMINEDLSFEITSKVF